MNKLILKSPAKVNLYLNVLRKRPDGYHDIKTVFEKIALFDIVTIRGIKKGIRITSSDPGLPTNKRNLAYKAVELLFEAAGFKGGAWVDIDKKIPVSAGLGGGSSNAAAALLGANRFFKLGFTNKELVCLGKKIGADVPFFLQKSSFAVGTERGDRLLPISSYTNIWHIIVSFNFGVSTKLVYEALNLKLTPIPADVRIHIPTGLKNGIDNLAVSIYNRLEGVVFSRFGIVKAVKKLLLEEGAYGAVLSGSGPTIFGIAKTREEAVAVQKRVQRILRHGCPPGYCSGKRRVSRVLVLETMKGALGYGNHGSKDIFKGWE